MSFTPAAVRPQAMPSRRTVDWQRDFETRFDYDETDDQLHATAEIKQDMEKGLPHGSSALRRCGRGQDRSGAARRLQVHHGRKQCALLAPTTLLAWQHYNTLPLPQWRPSR